MLALCLPVLLSAAAPAADALPALSPSIEADADYLLTTADFMDAQFGMGIEAVEERESQVLVRTTGAEFAFDAAASALRLRQRLGKAREVAVASFAPGALADLRVARRGSGAVLLQARGGALQMRVNADSLLMVRDAQSLAVSCRVSLQPGTVRQQGGDFLFLDEYGGLGTYLATGSPGAGTMPEDPGADYTLDADQVLWIAVAPPRPYDWDASCRDRVVWHWSRETGYPSDAQIEEWSKYGNLLLQQAEVMLWKDWMLRFEPRNGLEEFERVNRTCERLGMRNYVYTSPHYFLTGTGGEGRAINSFEGFTGWVPGDGRGLNWPVFLAEIRKVMHEYKPDGLYFDGIYGNIVRTYLISRKAREVVGDDGILEYHATWSPPGGGVYLPQIDTYYTFILRGEGCPEMYEDPDYLRYFVSTHNISNSIGVLCNNNDYQLTEEFIGRLLDNNIRLHLIPGWLGDYRKEALETHYWPVLTDSLRPPPGSRAGRLACRRRGRPPGRHRPAGGLPRGLQRSGAGAPGGACSRRPRAPVPAPRRPGVPRRPGRLARLLQRQQRGLAPRRRGGPRDPQPRQHLRLSRAPSAGQRRGGPVSHQVSAGRRNVLGARTAPRPGAGLRAHRPPGRQPHRPRSPGRPEPR